MITALSDNDLKEIALSDEAIRAAVETGLVAQSEGSAVAEPTTVFNPVPGRDDLIAVIRGALPKQGMAMVKTVGGFPDNANRGLATNPGSLTLIETETGQVTGLLPAARITTERTAMVSAIGVEHLARPGAGVLACIGTRGVALQSIHYIARRMPLSEIRIHGRNSGQAKAAAIDLARIYGLPVSAPSDWQSCLEGADIMIDGAALPGDRPMFPLAALTPGCVVIAYGAYSALPSGLMDRVDRLVVDRWVEDGRGALGPHIRSGEVTAQTVTTTIGAVIQGHSQGRQSVEDAIVFNHRGTAACDIALAQSYLAAAGNQGLGTALNF